MRIAAETLPDDPFRSSSGYLLGRIFGTALGLWMEGHFDPDKNMERVVRAMDKLDIPPNWSRDERESWLEGLSTPLRFDSDAFRGLCQHLHAHDAAIEALLAEHRWFQESKWVDYLTASPPALPGRKEGRRYPGILDW